MTHRTPPPAHLLERDDPTDHPLSFRHRVEETLFESRQVFLFGEINEKVSAWVTKQLVALATLSDDPITLLINSPGGHVEAADTVFDMISWISAPVQVLGTGWVASAGAHIFLAPPRGASRCRIPASCCTNPGVVRAVRPSTSELRPRRSSKCGVA